MAQQRASLDCSSDLVSNGDYNASESEINETASLPIGDQHSTVAVRAGLITTSIVLLVFSLAALVALSRTKTIPTTARTLSSSLLWFDSATMLAFAFRNMVDDSFISNLLTMFGLTMSSASFVNIAVMSFDRVICFQWPYFYIRHFTHGSYVIVYYMIIVGTIIPFIALWIDCCVTMPSFWEIRQCLLPLTTVFLASSHVICVLICIPCFVWITVIVIKNQRKERSKKDISSTISVVVCSINYGFTTIIALTFLFTACHTTIILRRTISQLLYMMNGFVDTCVYVLWFKECRYQLLNIVGVLVPALRQKIARMRNEVFDLSGAAHGATTTSNS